MHLQGFPRGGWHNLWQYGGPGVLAFAHTGYLDTAVFLNLLNVDSPFEHHSKSGSCYRLGCLFHNYGDVTIIEYGCMHSTLHTYRGMSYRPFAAVYSQLEIPWNVSCDWG